MNECTVTLESVVLPGHTHTCIGDCATMGHKCSDPSCRRFYGVAGC